MEIVVITETVKQTKDEQGAHILDFGNLKLNSKAIVEFKVLTDKPINLDSTCGCSTAVADQEQKIGKIEYKNTHVLGKFIKTITLNTKQIIKIKGNVTAN